VTYLSDKLKLDMERVELIQAAQELGLSSDEIREFFGR
jgi:DNA-binding transcriptional MerR regulator